MYLYPSKPSPPIRPFPSNQTKPFDSAFLRGCTATAMPDLAVHDPSPFDPFPTGDPPFFDENLLPADVHFSLDSDYALDLDLDLDVNFDGDFLCSFLDPSPDTASPPPDAPPPETTSPHPNARAPDIFALSSSRTPADQSVPTSPDSATSVVANPEEDQSATAPKRKRYTDPNSNPKFQRPEETNSSSVFTPGDNEDDKRRVRLMRNRESAQLSRQRKKHYVEELEDKVKSMQTTITDLNNRVSYFMAENASLRQQLGVKGPPPAAVYPPPVHYPWIPGYAYRPPPGSHVPLVPIPRIKTQQPAPAPKVRKSGCKKGESKSTAKKVAGVSLFGLMFIILILGSVLPVINFMSGVSVVQDEIVSHPHRSVSGRLKSGNNTDGVGLYSDGFSVKEKHVPNARVSTQNSSEAIPALLYVPRNGKHVKIDGNLIIHSVVASEKALKEKSLRDKAKQSTVKEGNDTSLATSGSIASALAISQAGKLYRSSVEQQRDAYADSSKSTPVDGPLQQWFREGLAGPVLNSGMCTEVFQFEVSPSAHPGGIVPASSVVNASESLRKSASGKIRNRRILYPQGPIPIAGSILNDTEQVGGSSANDSFHGKNTPVPSMVVSVLADPREVGDGDGEGMMSPKSLSRVFVVVLLDSVKYVTYSCVLPFKSSSPHLVD